MKGYKLKGLQSLLKDLDNRFEGMIKEMDLELGKSVITIAADARSRVPVNKGRIARSINTDISKHLQKSVRVSDPIGPYVEFGTGAYVFKATSYSHEADERQYAKLFYVSGKGTTKASPYLFPAVHAETPKLWKELKDCVKRAVTK